MNQIARAVLPLLLVVTGCVAIVFGAAAENRLTIATGGAAGVYNPLGGAMAKVLATNLPGTSASHDATSASIDNIKRVIAGKADLALVQADAAWDGFKGYGKFQDAGPQPIRTLAVLYPNSLQVVVKADSGINRISDLRGKRVSTGAKGSGVELWGYRLFEANGIDPSKDIVESKLLVGPSASALQSGEIDAFIWSGGVPTKGIETLAKEAGVEIRLLNTAAAVPSMLRHYGPVYTDGDIEANTYTGIKRKVSVAQVWNLLIARADMDDQEAYRIVKTLFDHKPELVQGHVMAANLDLKTQPRGGSPIPFHTGAKRFYRENNIRILR